PFDVISLEVYARHTAVELAFVDCHSAATEPRLAWTHREKKVPLLSIRQPAHSLVKPRPSWPAVPPASALACMTRSAVLLIWCLSRAPKPDFGTPTHRHPGPPSEALLKSISGGGMGKAEANVELFFLVPSEGCHGPGVAFAGAFPLFAPSAQSDGRRSCSRISWRCF